MRNQTVPYQEGYTFGVGVNSATGDRREFGATGTPEKMQGGLIGGDGSFSMLKIQETSDLETHLGISADASGGIGLFSGSARFNFARDCKIQNNSIILLLKCTKSFGYMQIVKADLDPAAAQLVANGQVDLFMERFGDCFVGGVESGGQFFGVIRIDASTEQAVQDISLALSGSYGTFNSDVSGSLKTATMNTHSKVSSFLYYEGGNVKTSVDTPEDLFKAKLEWEDSVLNAAKPYAVQLLPWILANGPNPPNAADLEHQRDVLKSCATMRSKVIDCLNLLEYYMDPLHKDDFENLPDYSENISKAHGGFNSDYDIIESAASYAIDNAKQAVEPETYARTVKNMAGYTLTTLPPLPKRVAGTVQFVKVPPLIGLDFRYYDQDTQTEDDVLTRLANVGLKYQVTSVPNPDHNFWDAVMTQDPPAGTIVPVGYTVKIVLGQEP
jgi:hypothetical protein